MQLCLMQTSTLNKSSYINLEHLSCQTVYVVLQQESRVERTVERNNHGWTMKAQEQILVIVHYSFSIITKCFCP